MPRKPSLTVEAVLAWARAWHAERGTWPHEGSGPVPGAPDETWKGIDAALRKGARGLPGGLSLARLLAGRLGARLRAIKPDLTVPLILSWADAHHKHHAKWPDANSGPVEVAPGETWKAVDAALRRGVRGLPGGTSLADLLHRERGFVGKFHAPRLTVRDIRKWAKAHERRTGERPRVNSGDIPECPCETWSKVEQALYQGLRGLPGGSSLARLLGEVRRGPKLGRRSPRGGKGNRENRA